jgi:hypothetical protein
MLTIDDDAVAALEQIGTIRITAEDVDGEAEISIDEATEPADGDDVIESGGAKVFLAPSAAEVLADRSSASTLTATTSTSPSKTSPRSRRRSGHARASHVRCQTRTRITHACVTGVKRPPRSGGRGHRSGATA